jgi:hypothetical protein
MEPKKFCLGTAKVAIGPAHKKAGFRVAQHPVFSLMIQGIVDNFLEAWVLGIGHIT